MFKYLYNNKANNWIETIYWYIDMRIRKPRGLTRKNLLVGIVLGTISGIYIWKPFLDEKLIEAKKEQEKKHGSD